MILRRVAPADHAAIGEVVAAAFGRIDEAALVAAVRAEAAVLSEWVADFEGEIVGHVLFSRATCQPDILAAALAPLAVGPSFERRGFGAALVRQGLDDCRERGAKLCVVLGAPAYYGRFGFTAAPPSLQSPYSALSAFQALAFAPEALSAPLALDYPAAFSA